MKVNRKNLRPMEARDLRPGTLCFFSLDSNVRANHEACILLSRDESTVDNAVWNFMCWRHRPHNGDSAYIDWDLENEMISGDSTYLVPKKQAS